MMQQRIQTIQKRIDDAALRSGRSGKDITLIAVSKMHTVEEIKEALSCGITNLGENKVQELNSKYTEITQDVNWHLIGHLQTNKVKQIVDKVSLIHSVDSLHLAQEIDKRCREIGKTMDILIQVNAAGEESKFGVPCEEALPLAEEIQRTCPNIKIRGLMHIAPAADNPDDVRKYFRDVKNIYNQMTDVDILSMGMSHDFEVAIEEGANMVRIGTSIFGERDYSHGNV
ncbi:MAG: YggS family pyridoxal phosphate-dependent enzyme [Clostridia bacterium]|nr:YggS family pyridoxal phosphate-dependent enzyme [Clostridia bacterium]